MERNPHLLEFKTKLLNCGYVIHYTCNAPNQEILDRNGIKSIGSNYGADPTEVVMIPQKRFLKEGLTLSEDKQVLGIQAEYLLRVLDSKDI